MRGEKAGRTGLGALLARAVVLPLGYHGDLPKIPLEGKLLLLKEDLENHEHLTEENAEAPGENTCGFATWQPLWYQLLDSFKM